MVIPVSFSCALHTASCTCNAQENETGITIHHVNEHYDQGDIIFQIKVPLTKTDTPQTVAAKIHDLEIKYFALVIEDCVMKEV